MYVHLMFSQILSLPPPLLILCNGLFEEIQLCVWQWWASISKYTLYINTNEIEQKNNWKSGILLYIFCPTLLLESLLRAWSWRYACKHQSCHSNNRQGEHIQATDAICSTEKVWWILALLLSVHVPIVPRVLLVSFTQLMINGSTISHAHHSSCCHEEGKDQSSPHDLRLRLEAWDWHRSVSS